MIGKLCLGVGILLLPGIDSQTPFAQIYFLLGLIGLRIGTFISPNTSAIMGAAPKTRQGTVAEVVATARSTAMVLGVAMAGAIYATFSNRLYGDQALFLAIQSTFRISSGLAFLGAVLSLVRD